MRRGVSDSVLQGLWISVYLLFSFLPAPLLGRVAGLAQRTTKPGLFVVPAPPRLPTPAGPIEPGGLVFVAAVAQLVQVGAGMDAADALVPAVAVAVRAPAQGVA